MKIVISTNNVDALRCGRFAAFGAPGLSIFILRCARAGHGGYLVLCPVNQPLMRLAENERSEVRSASRIILRAKLSRATI